ncbi:hypothetical protein BaRGS_00029969 [Batillaria attramentaria]|uniref:Sulfatase N-terminal domain-containing protein n=1 Tax=Batillaria attramentaria TaxID=370345 RepID=A0ABD0JV28_9CAEN
MMNLQLFLLILGQCIVLARGYDQPNIVFVLADDYGFNDIGYHGSEIYTPNLDRIADGGVKLENYYVQPICTPTRSQIMSGRYQIHTGLQHDIIWPWQAHGLPLDSPTLADKLREAGYATHAVGKWHLGFYKEDYVPTHRGFDSFYGYLTGGEDYFTHWLCSSPGSTEKDYVSIAGYCGYDLRDNDTPVKTESGNYSTHLFTDRAISLIKSHDKSKPMFLYLAYQAVHAPMEVPESYVTNYDHIHSKLRRTYAGMVSCMDEGVGNLTKALQDAGMWDNTVFIFSTDNGGQIFSGANNWPLRGWKLSLWEGGLRGVGFVHSPLLQKPGSVNHELIHVSDWFPTLIRVAGGSLNGTKPLDGVDHSGAASQRKEILHNIDPLYKPKGDSLYPDIFDTRTRAAIRVGEYKLITGDPSNGSWIPPPSSNLYVPKTNHDAPTKNVWLFNLQSDPYEEVDLADERPDIVKQLLQRLAYYNSTAVPAVYPSADPQCDPKLHGGFWGPWQ